MNSVNLSNAQYRISPTLLDSYFGYVNSNDIWEKYWGRSKSPAKTPNEFHKEKFEELIKSINREDREVGQAAQYGSAFNDVVDIFLGNKVAGATTYGYCDSDYFVIIDNERFVFPLDLIKAVVSKVEGAICQQRLEGVISTRFGKVVLSGYSDHITSFNTVDLKTTGNYEPGQFRDNHQHKIYPYIMHQMGAPIDTFTYLVVEWYISKKDGRITRWEIFEEQYLYDKVWTPHEIRKRCEQLIAFVKQHEKLITNNHFWNDKNTE